MDFIDDKRLDDLYDLCDKLMTNNELDKLDKLFVTDKKYSIVFMLGMLTATAPVKSKLPNRKLFIDKHRDELTDKMLVGLE